MFFVDVGYSKLNVYHFS